MHLVARISSFSSIRKHHRYHEYTWHLYPKNGLALGYASVHGHIEVAKYLISCGANVGILQDICLTIAAEYGHFDIVVLLHENGGDLHADTPCISFPHISSATRCRIRDYYKSHGARVIQRI